MRLRDDQPGSGEVRPANRQSRSVNVSDGTIIHLILSDDLSSATSHDNDLVHLEVTQEVVVSEAIVISKGSAAIGHILIATPKGRWGKSGQLAFAVDYAKAVDGNQVRLRATAERGTDKQGAIRPAMALGLSGLLIHGKDVTIPKGTAISAYVDGDEDVAANLPEKTTQ